MKITVVTVCYNSEVTIGDTLASVAVQDWGNLEHIVIDGGSSDRTLRIVEEFERPQLRVVSEPDGGIYDAMNKGLQRASGDAIGFLNSDDFFCRPDAVRLIAERLVQTGADAVVGEVALVDPSNLSRVRRHYRVNGYQRWMMRFGHMPPHPTLYIRRQVFMRIGEFDESFRIAGDFDLAVRLLLRDRAQLEKINETLVGFREGGVSTRGLRAKVQINREILQSLRRHGFSTTIVQLYARYLLKIFQYAGRPNDYRVPDFLHSDYSGAQRSP